MLEKTECERLRAHYGTAYLSKALYDVAVHRENSKAAELIGVRPTRNERRRAKKKEEEDVGYIQSIWSSLMQTLRAAFRRVVAYVKKYVTWRDFINVGFIPPNFDAIYASVDSMASLTGKAFIAAFSKVGSELTRIWIFVKNLFSSSDVLSDPVVDEMEEETNTLVSYAANLSEYVLSYIEPIGRKIAGGFMSLLETIQRAMYDAIQMASTAATLLFDAAQSKSDAVRRLLFGVICGFLDIGKVDGVDRVKAGINTLFTYFKEELADVLPMLPSLVDEESIQKSLIWKTDAFLAIPIDWLVSSVTWLLRAVTTLSVSCAAWVMSFIPSIGGLFSTLCGDYLSTYFTQDGEKAQAETRQFEDNVAALHSIMEEHTKNMTAATRTRIRDTLDCVEQVQRRHRQLGEVTETSGKLSFRADILLGLTRNEMPSQEQIKELLLMQTGYTDVADLFFVQMGLNQLVASELLVAIDEVQHTVINSYEPIGIKIEELEREKAKLVTKRQEKYELYRRQQERHDMEVAIETEKMEAFRMRDFKRMQDRGETEDDDLAMAKLSEYKVKVEVHQKSMLDGFEDVWRKELNDLDDQIFKVDLRLRTKTGWTTAGAGVLALVALGFVSAWAWNRYPDVLTAVFNRIVFSPPEAPQSTAQWLWSGVVKRPWNHMWGVIETKDVSMESWIMAILGGGTGTVLLLTTVITAAGGTVLAACTLVWKIVFGSFFFGVSMLADNGFQYSISELQSVPGAVSAAWTSVARGIMSIGHARAEVSRDRMVSAASLGSRVVGTIGTVTGNPMLAGVGAAGQGLIQQYARAPGHMTNMLRERLEGEQQPAAAQTLPLIEARRADLQKNGPAVRKALPAAIPRAQPTTILEIEDVTDEDPGDPKVMLRRIREEKKKQQQQEETEDPGDPKVILRRVRAEKRLQQKKTK